MKKTMDHAIIRETTLAKDFFTWHGLHMNTSVKTLMANTTASDLKNILP
jgi:hypothetical protein